MQNDVIVITGPTASGKTALAHIIAKTIASEIIVADSMKVYKEAGVAISKPSRDYQREVQYHLIDLIKPSERYDVGKFYRDACKIIDVLHKKDIVPVVSGGTALYISKLVEGLAEMPEITQDMKSNLEKKPADELYEELKKIDPERAGQLHPNMKKRIVRAIGVYRHTGKKMSKLLLTTKPPPYNFILLGINWDRKVLYERIDKRVDKMIDNGLVDEAKELYDRYGESPLFESLGYRQMISYIKGEAELPTVIDDIKRATRNYAKNQLIWWRNKSITWLNGEMLQKWNL